MHLFCFNNHFELGSSPIERKLMDLEDVEVVYRFGENCDGTGDSTIYAELINAKSRMMMLRSWSPNTVIHQRSS